MQGSAHARFLLLETSSKSFPRLQGPDGFYIFMHQPWAKAEFTGEVDTTAQGRCPGCMSVPHPGCSSGSQEKWRSPQKSGFGENFAKIIIILKNKRCKGQLCFCIGNLMRLWPLGWKYTSQLFPFWAHWSFSPSRGYMSFCQQPTGLCFNLVLFSHCWQRSLRLK